MFWIWKRRTTPQKTQEEKRKENTEQIAYQVFQNRQLLGRPGDQQSDWQTAEKIVRNPMRRTLFDSHCQLIKLEKGVWEPLLAWANNQALFGLIGVIGNASIIVGVVAYVNSEKHRRDAEVLNAWQTITSAHGQAGSGGRIQALEFLNASPGANWRRRFPWCPNCTWPQESLAGINLGVEAVDAPVGDRKSPSDDKQSDDRKPGVYLSQIQLPNADLRSANLQGANLYEANLQGAFLLAANLQGAKLYRANLQEAVLAVANLQGAELYGANLQGAHLMVANLQRAHLVGADLQGASLEEVELQGIGVVRGANLQGALYSDEQTSEQECEISSLRHPCPTQFPKGFDPKAAGMKLVK